MTIDDVMAIRDGIRAGEIDPNDVPEPVMKAIGEVEAQEKQQMMSPAGSESPTGSDNVEVGMQIQHPALVKQAMKTGREIAEQAAVSETEKRNIAEENAKLKEALSMVGQERDMHVAEKEQMANVAQQNAEVANAANEIVKANTGKDIGEHEAELNHKQDVVGFAELLSKDSSIIDNAIEFANQYSPEVLQDAASKTNNEQDKMILSVANKIHENPAALNDAVNLIAQGAR